MIYIVIFVLTITITQCSKSPSQDITKDFQKTKTESQKSSIEDFVSDEQYVGDAPLPPSPFYGYFDFFTEGDYYHAVFRLLDSTRTSLWMPNDKDIERQLIDNREKLLKISYYIVRDFMPEAGDTITMEFIKTIEVATQK